MKKEFPFDFMKIPGMGFKKKEGPDPKYATFNRRMMAATLDSLLIMILIAPVIDGIFDNVYGPIPLDMVELITRVKQEPDPEAGSALFWHTLYSSGFLARWIANAIWQTIVLGAVTGLCWRKWSATPGKMLLRMKIVDATTEAHITDRQIIIRLLGYIVSTVTLLAGFFWIGVDKRRQGWHDKMANTVVIVVPRKKKVKSGSPVAGPSDSQAPSAAE